MANKLFGFLIIIPIMTLSGCGEEDKTVSYWLAHLDEMKKKNLECRNKYGASFNMPIDCTTAVEAKRQNMYDEAIKLRERDIKERSENMK